MISPEMLEYFRGSGTYRRLGVGFFRIIYAVSEDPSGVRVVLVGRDDQAR